MGSIPIARSIFRCLPLAFAPGGALARFSVSEVSMRPNSGHSLRISGGLGPGIGARITNAQIPAEGPASLCVNRLKTRLDAHWRFAYNITNCKNR